MSLPVSNNPLGLPTFEVPLTINGMTNKVWYFYWALIGKKVSSLVTLTAGSFTNANITVNSSGVISAISSGTGGSGTVTSVGLSTVSGDIVLTGTNPVTVSGTIGVDLSAGAQAALGLAGTALQPIAGLSGSYTNTNLTLNASGQITSVSNGSSGSAASPYPPFEEYAAELTWEDQQIPLLGTVWPGGPLVVNGPFTALGSPTNAGTTTIQGANTTLNAGSGTSSTISSNSQLIINAGTTMTLQQAGVTGMTGSGGHWSIPAPGSGAGGTATLGITAQTTSGQSRGLLVNAGFNSGDYSVQFAGQSGATVYMTVYGDGGVTVGPASVVDEGAGTINVSKGYYLNGALVLPASPYPPFEEYAAELTWEDQQIPLLGTVWPGGPLVVNGMATVSAPGETIKVVGDTAFLNFRNTALSSVLQLGTVEAYTGAGSNATDAAVGAIGVLNLYAAGSTTAGISLSSTGIAAPKSPVASATTTVLTGLANFKSTLSTAASAVLTADAALTVTCNETGWYDVEAYLVFFEATSGAGGFQFDFNAGGGTIANASFAVNGFSTAAFTNAAVTSIATATSIATIVTSSSAPSWCRVKGTIQVTVAGTFGIRWAQASILAIDPTTLTAGSKIVLTKIG